MFFNQKLNFIVKNYVPGESLMKHCGLQIPKLKRGVMKVPGPEQQNKNEPSGSKKKKGRK